MLDSPTTFLIALLALIVVVLLWQSVVLVRIASRLEQISRMPTSQKPLEGANNASAPAPTPQSPQSDFDRFLADDPSRQALDKKEQAAAFRAWRKQRGLTWNANG